MPLATGGGGAGGNEHAASPSGLSVDQVAAASQRATKKMEKNIERIKTKFIPEALKTLENNIDRKVTCKLE